MNIRTEMKIIASVEISSTSSKRERWDNRPIDALGQWIDENVEGAKDVKFSTLQGAARAAARKANAYDADNDAIRFDQ